MSKLMRLIGRYVAGAAIGASAGFYGLTALAQENGSTPAPPKPHVDADDSDQDSSRSTKNRNESKNRDESDDDESRSGQNSRDDRSRSSRETARDSSRSDRDRSSQDRDDRTQSSRDRSDSRSYSRDSDDDRSRSRDRDDENTDDRSSSRDRSSTRDRDEDRYSSRDRDDRATSRDRMRDDVRDTARGVRDTARDTRDFARDTARDARGAARDVRDTIGRGSRSSQPEFDAATARPADVGVWFNRSTSNGLVVSDVASSGPISQIGLREGDRIVSVDGNRVNGQRQFMQDLFYNTNASQVPIIINRNGTQRTIYAQPSALVEHYHSSFQSDPLEQFGLVLDDRYQNQLVVWKTIPRTPAYYAGVRAGDMITAVDDSRVRHHEDLVQAIQDAESSGNGDVRLTVQRGQQVRHLDAEVQQVASHDQPRTSYRPTLETEPGYQEYPAVETQPRATVPARPTIVPRPGILPRNR